MKKIVAALLLSGSLLPSVAIAGQREPAPVAASTFAASTVVAPTTFGAPIVAARGSNAPTAVARADPAGALIAAHLVVAANAAPDATAAAEGEGGIPEIVVTATKRETNLQQTPIAISVVNDQLIRDRHIQNFMDLADGAIPSLRIATFEARQSALTVGIRGIVPFDANQTARDQGVGVYIDGVYLGRQQGLNAALFDVERIEVLRGPQGTLFGRNTEGGAVSIVTKAPTGVFGARAIASVGNYGSRSGELHLNFPAFDNLAVKVDGVYQHQDATIKDPLAGQTGWNYHNAVGGRIAARWTPFEGFTADLSYDIAKDENTPFYSQLVNYNPLGRPVATMAQIVAAGNKIPAGFIAPLPALVVVGTDRLKVADIGVPQQPSVDRTEGVMASLKYKVSPALEFRSITSFRNVSTNQWDNSGGAHRVAFAPNGKFSRYSLSELHQNQFSQEFQAVGSLSHVDYVLGLYYFTERVTEAAATPSTNQWNADGTSYTILSPIVTPPITSGNQGWDRASWFVQRNSRAKAKSYAAFGQATWTPIDQLHLTVGGRYTKDKRDGLLFTVLGQPTNFVFTYSNSRFDPLVVLALDATRDVHLYAKYSTGFRAGGANDRSRTFTAFGPESVKAYEVGAKLDMLNHMLRLNLAGYMMDRTGTQTDFDNVDTTQGSPTFNLHTEETRNAPGVSKIRGFEAELTAKPTNNLTLAASYAYTYTKVPPTGNPFLPGNPLFPVFVVYTPRNAASGSIDYEEPLGGSGTRIRLHLDANYADSTYSFQAEPVKTDKSFIVNGRIAVADILMNGTGTKATLSIWSRNLLDEHHIYRRSAANAAILGDYANFNAPRTFGVEAAIQF